MTKKVDTNEISEICRDESSDTQVALVRNWQDDLAEFAADAAKEEHSGNRFLSLQSGRLSIDGLPVSGNKLDCVIIASCFENVYYPPGKFNPEKPVSPICFSFSAVESLLQPHNDVEQYQSGVCSTCGHNQWNDDGSGKSCKNTRRLALLPADCIKNPASILSCDKLYMRLPVTSVRGWSRYVQILASQKRPPFAAITTISTEPDAKTQFKVIFSCKEIIDDAAAVDELIAAHRLAVATIGFPYDLTKAAGSNLIEKF